MMLVVALALAAAPSAHVWRASPAHPLVVFAHRETEDAALRVIFRAGAADDGIEYGLTRLAQVSMLRGQSAEAYQELDDAVFAADGDIEVVTGVRHCSFALSAPRGAFEQAAPKMLKHLLAPHVSDDGITLARRIITTDPLQAGSAEDLQAFIAGQVLFLQSTDNGGDYSNPVWGDLDTLRRIEPHSVRAHIAEHMTPANAIIVVAGRFDEAKMKAAIAAYKGGIEHKLARPDLSDVLPRAYTRNAPREIHMQVQVLDPPKDATAVARARIVTELVSERVFWKFRKLGHSYSPSAALFHEEWLDFVLVAMTVTPKASQNHEVLLRDELAAVAEGKFDAAEIARAKAQAKAHLWAIDEHPAELARALEPMARGQLTVGPEVIAAVDAVDDAQVKQAAQAILAQSRGINFLFGRSRAEGN